MHGRLLLGARRPARRGLQGQGRTAHAYAQGPSDRPTPHHGPRPAELIHSFTLSVLERRLICSDVWYDPCTNPRYPYPKVGSCVVQRTSRWWTPTRRLQERIRQHPTVIRQLRIGIRRLRTATRQPLKRTRSPAIRNPPRGL